ncbi:MAG: Fur family transcriptional regulator [Solirubrobacterales bacterium]
MGYEKELKSFGVKITKPRLMILNILEDASSSIDAETISSICREKNFDIDFSTVYRNLELFESKDLVEKFDLGNGKYSYILKKEHHKHTLLCKLCHKEVEIDCPMQQVEEIIKNRTGFSSIEHQLKIEGICEECKHRK